MTNIEILERAIGYIGVKYIIEQAYMDPISAGAIYAGLNALRAQQEVEKNELLTLEELREIVQQLESCGYECEAGPLVLNADFLRLKEAICRHPPKEEENE